MFAQENAFRSVLSTTFTRRTLLASATAGLVAPALTASLHPAIARHQATPAFADLEGLLADGLTKGMPGIALAVEQAGTPIFSGAAGVASIEDGTPLAATDRFRIYSIAKTFTATIVLQMADEEILTLDDTVTMWLDDPAVARIPNVDQVTIRQLLNHTSGIYDFADDNDSPFWEDAFTGPEADWTRIWMLPEMLAFADGASHAPYFAPGEGVHYSNTGYLLLGMIVEKATGNAFVDELQNRILTPLDLADTFLATGGDMPDGVVEGYQLLGGELVNVSVSNLSWIWTAGGMVSTTADLMRFANAVFAGELLSPASFQEMFTFVPTPNPNKGEGMGLFQLATPSGTLVGMDGSGPGFVSNMMRLIDEDVTAVVLVNRAPDDGSTEALRDAAFAWTLSQQ